MGNCIFFLWQITCMEDEPEAAAKCESMDAAAMYGLVAAAAAAAAAAWWWEAAAAAAEEVGLPAAEGYPAAAAMDMGL